MSGLPARQSSSAPNSHSFQLYQSALRPQLLAFEEYLKDQITTFEPALQEVIASVLGYGGKRLRPSLVMACAGLAGGQTTPERALRMATIVELIHLATLVHDDILDSASTRHGATAHHLLYDVQISVLTGDTLFLRANELAAVDDDVWVGRAVATAAKATCTGEIAQSLAARYSKGPISYADYEAQLLGKTGKLFGLSCALGAYLAGMSEADRKRMATYGESFGIAYQLFDDAVDIWGSEAEYKKTLRTDQIQGKWTLPWILLADKIGATQVQAIWQGGTIDTQIFTQHNILEACTQTFEGYLGKATQAIAGLPQAEILQAPLGYVREHWARLAAIGA